MTEKTLLYLEPLAVFVLWILGIATLFLQCIYIGMATTVLGIGLIFYFVGGYRETILEYTG